MHKTVSISIGSVLFVIDEEAYAVLAAYLDAVKKHFASLPDSSEVVSDIEDRIAEEFSTRLTKRKNVVLREDVDAVIAMMGTVEDFRKFEGEEGETTSSFPKIDLKKVRIYRDADDQIIGGVCSGIAKYFGIDPIIVRLIFGLSLFLGGFGVLLYILLWIIVPEARTTAQKVEMTGGRVTLATLQKKIDDVIPPSKRKSTIEKVISFPFVILGTLLRGIASILQVAVPVILRVLGFFLMIAMSLVLAFITFLFLVLLFNPASPYIGIPVGTVIGASSYMALLLSAYFIVFVPVVSVLLLGTALLTWRRVIGVPVVIALAILWFGAISIGAALGATVSSEIEVAYERLQDENREKIVANPLAVGAFTALAVEGVSTVDVVQGDTASVIVDASPEVLSRIMTTEVDGTLTIMERHGTSRCMFFCTYERPVIRVTVPSLAAFSAEGNLRVTMKGFDQDAMTISSDGVSRITADLEIDQLKVFGHGVTRFILTGTGEALTAELEGVSRIDAEAYDAKTVMIHIDGPSRIALDSPTSVTGEINGPGRLTYRTEPATVNVETNGPARMELRGERGESEW